MSHHRDSSDDEDDTFVTTGTPLQTYDIGVYMYCGTFSPKDALKACSTERGGDAASARALSTYIVVF